MSRYNLSQLVGWEQNKRRSVALALRKASPEAKEYLEKKRGMLNEVRGCLEMLGEVMDRLTDLDAEYKDVYRRKQIEDRIHQTEVEIADRARHLEWLKEQARGDTGDSGQQELDLDYLPPREPSSEPVFYKAEAEAEGAIPPREEPEPEGGNT